MMAARSSVNARLRTSITTATLVMAPLACAPSSTMVAISSGGRLSTTNQPRSSRHFAAVLRPAPDRPVTTATSIPLRSDTFLSIPCRHRLPWVQGRQDGRRGLPAHARHAADLVDGRRPQPFHRPEVLDQRGLPGLAEPGYPVERGRGHPLGALLPVVRDGEAVCL